jgi:hypothetical protein
MIHLLLGILVEMMVIFTYGYLLLWLSDLIVVLIGYGLISNLVSFILYYFRWPRPTYAFMWASLMGAGAPPQKLFINTHLMSHL